MWVNGNKVDGILWYVMIKHKLNVLLRYELYVRNSTEM